MNKTTIFGLGMVIGSLVTAEVLNKAHRGDKKRIYELGKLVGLIKGQFEEGIQHELNNNPQMKN